MVCGNRATDSFIPGRFNPNSEVGTGSSRKVLIDRGSGRRRQENFAPAGCRRGAHGVTRPTVVGSRRVFSTSLPTSEFGFNPELRCWRRRLASVVAGRATRAAMVRADAGKSPGPVSCVRGFPRGRGKPHAGRVCSPGNTSAVGPKGLMPGARGVRSPTPCWDARFQRWQCSAHGPFA